jgi:hypothetical protein
MSRRQALVYGGLAAAVPLLAAMRPAGKPNLMDPRFSSGSGSHLLPQQAAQDGAELYWAWQQYEIAPPVEDIGDVYDGLASAMQDQGWAGVQHQEDVHGYKPGIDLFAAVLFLPVGGQNIWGLISVGGDATAEQAQQEIRQLQDLVNPLFVTL